VKQRRIVLLAKQVHPDCVICPHCSHKFSLGLDKYLTSSQGHHHCPACLKRFQIVITASSFALILAATVLAAGTPTVIVFFLTHNFLVTIGTYALLILLLVLPFDWWLNSHIRPTKPVK
jgi:hypothetical protein